VHAPGIANGPHSGNGQGNPQASLEKASDLRALDRVNLRSGRRTPARANVIPDSGGRRLPPLPRTTLQSDELVPPPLHDSGPPLDDEPEHESPPLLDEESPEQDSPPPLEESPEHESPELDDESPEQEEGSSPDESPEHESPEEEDDESPEHESPDPEEELEDAHDVSALTSTYTPEPLS